MFRASLSCKNLIWKNDTRIFQRINRSLKLDINCLYTCPLHGFSLVPSTCLQNGFGGWLTKLQIKSVMRIKQTSKAGLNNRWNHQRNSRNDIPIKAHPATSQARMRNTNGIGEYCFQSKTRLFHCLVPRQKIQNCVQVCRLKGFRQKIGKIWNTVIQLGTLLYN